MLHRDGRGGSLCCVFWSASTCGSRRLFAWRYLVPCLGRM